MKKYILLVLILFLASCAMPVKQVGLKSKFQSGEGGSFTLSKNIKIRLSTGYSVDLKENTKWEMIGKIGRGSVYKTRDQVVTVEGYNIHEAYIVVDDGFIVGFYLPVEETFTPIDKKKVTL